MSWSSDLVFSLSTVMGSPDWSVVASVDDPTVDVRDLKRGVLVLDGVDVERLSFVGQSERRLGRPRGARVR